VGSAGRRNLHSAESNVDRGAAYLDGNNRVQDTDGRLKRLQEAVLVREHAILPGLDTKADARMDVLRGRLEPRVALRLQNR
jgi:hypothetical protein